MSSGLVSRPLPTTGMSGAEDGLALLDERRHPARLAEARHAGILAPFGVVADLQRHGIDDALAAEQLQHAHAVFVRLDALWPVQRVHLEAGRDRTAVAEAALQRLQHLDVETRAVPEAAAVAVRAAIEARLEELHRQRVVAGGHLEQVEARLFGALAGFDVHIDDAADVGLIHLVAVDAARREDRRQPLARRTPEFARLERRRIAAAVPELYAGEAVVPVRDLAQVAKVDDIAAVPDACGRVRILVGLRMDRAILGEYGAPAALGLHAAEVRLRPGPLGSRPGAVRGLPEAVAQRLRPDPDRLEQNVVLGVACHESPIILVTEGIPAAAGKGRRAKAGHNMNFSGKAVLVTGSTTGIGEACARAFAESGAAVMVSGRDHARGAAVVESIRSAGGAARFLPADLREPGACDALIAATIAGLGGLDVLVNNAGILYTANAPTRPMRSGSIPWR